MKKLLLKYNARLKIDKLPVIQELVKKHELKIESIEEVKDGSSKIVKVVCVSGERVKIERLEKVLVRHASITKKVV